VLGWIEGQMMTEQILEPTDIKIVVSIFHTPEFIT